MNVSTLLDELATAVDTISGLRVYDTVPDRVSPPAAVLMLGAWQYDVTYDPAPMAVEVEITVIVPRVNPRNRQDDLHAYIAPTGSSSIKAAVEAGTYTQGVDVRVSSGGPLQDVNVGGVDYLGVPFTVSVLT